MPVIIALFDADVLPAVLMQPDDDAMLDALRALKHAPTLPDRAAAETWLAGLPAPSGWYDTPEAARAASSRLRQAERMSGQAVQDAREALGLSRQAFMEKLGYAGNSNTRHKNCFEIENGKKSLSPAATQALRALLAETGLDQLASSAGEDSAA